MKSKRNSPEYSFQHTQQRLQERYGLEITRQEYNNLTKRIEFRSFLPLYLEEDAGEKQEIYEFPFKGKRVLFVYSITKKRIKTVLPQRTQIDLSKYA